MKVISFVIISNPLVPDNRIIEKRDYEIGKSLADYIGDLNGEWVISCNGKILDQHKLNEVFPNPDDVIAIAPLLRGGDDDGGKGIMRLVATVALAYFTAGLGATTGLAGGALYATQVAVAIGGTLLINAVLPYQTPKTDDRNGDSTYGIDGAKNTSKEGSPVPVIYGHHRFGGNIIGNYTQLNGQTQYLNMLINLGEGVIAGVDVDSLQVNDQTVDDLGEKPEIQITHGNDDQRVLDGFNEQVTPFPVTINSELKDPAVWTNYMSSVGNNIDALRLDFVCSLFAIDKKGKEMGYSVELETQIRPVGGSDDDWGAMISGIPMKYADRGWIFDEITEGDVTTRFDPKGKTVTESKVGEQMLSDYPNKYIAETGKYNNYYVHKSELPPLPSGSKGTESGRSNYHLKGDSVTYDGKPGYAWSYTSSGAAGSGYVGAPLFSKNALPTYEYGNLICEGKVVGKYHKYHTLNKTAVGYNDSGLLGGSKGGLYLTLAGRNSTSAIRFNFKTARLKSGRYEIRVRRTKAPADRSTIGDRVQFTEVNEIVFSELAYNYTALLGVRIKVTDQISNIPKVTIKHLGKVIRVWDEQARRWVPSCRPDVGAQYYGLTERERNKWLPYLTAAEVKEVGKSFGGNVVPNIKALQRPAHTLEVLNTTPYDEKGFYQHSNPAWIVWDLLIDERYGAKVSPLNLDFVAFKRWAKFCNDNNITFDAIFDERENVWDAIAKIFRVGRAIPLKTGTKYSVSVECPKKSVMRFGQDNIVKNSFSTSWLSIEDRANEVELTYFDEASDYKQRIVKVYDKDALRRGVKPNSSSLTMIGIVREEHAIREANYTLNNNKIIQSVSFDAMVESISCSIGDVITVQHDMMEWGRAGKIRDVKVVSPNVYELTLDHTVNFADSTEWKLLLSSNKESRGKFIVSAIYGNYISLTAFNPDNGRVRRCLVDGVDISVDDVFEPDGKSSGGIIVSDPSLFKVNSWVDLFDTDVLTSVNVTPSSYTEPTDKITIVTAITDLARYSSFMLGYNTYEAKKFTIRSISFSGDDMKRKISALEYIEEVFDDSDTDFTVVVDMPARSLSSVSNVIVSEAPVSSSTDWKKVKVTIGWEHDQPSYSTSNVYAQINDGSSIYLGSNRLTANITASVGDVIKFKITPVSVDFKEGSPSTIEHTVTGEFESKDDLLPFGATVTPASGGNLVSWVYGNNAVQQSLVFATEIFAIKSGTVVSAGMNIESFPTPESIPQADLENNLVLLDTSKSHQYLHQLNTIDPNSDVYWYFIRSVSRLKTDSAFVYAGNGKPVNSASYNTSTIYALAATKPALPQGGSYASPYPTINQGGVLVRDPKWQSNPPTPAANDTKSMLWTSSRRFCNFESLNDPAWNAPSKVSSPGDKTYTWSAYATNKAGLNFSTVFNEAVHKYVGYAYNKTSSTPSTVPSDYSWDLIVKETDFLSADDRSNIEKLAIGKLPDGSNIASESELNEKITSDLNAAKKEIADSISPITSKPASPVITSLVENANGTVTASIKPTPSDSITRYELWRSYNNLDFTLVASKPSTNSATAFTMTDSTLNRRVKVYYRVAAVNRDTYSEYGLNTINLVKSVPDPTNMSVASEAFTYLISWTPPSHPLLAAVEVLAQAKVNDEGFDETSATVVYRGLGNSFAYDVPIVDLTKYHQFWIRSVAAA